MTDFELDVSDDESTNINASVSSLRTRLKQRNVKIPKYKPKRVEIDITAEPQPVNISDHLMNLTEENLAALNEDDYELELEIVPEDDDEKPEVVFDEDEEIIEDKDLSSNESDEESDDVDDQKLENEISEGTMVVDGDSEPKQDIPAPEDDIEPHADEPETLGMPDEIVDEPVELVVQTAAVVEPEEHIVDNLPVETSEIGQTQIDQPEGEKRPDIEIENPNEEIINDSSNGEVVKESAHEETVQETTHEDSVTEAALQETADEEVVQEADNDDESSNMNREEQSDQAPVDDSALPEEPPEDPQENTKPTKPKKKRHFLEDEEVDERALELLRQSMTLVEDKQLLIHDDDSDEVEDVAEEESHSEAENENEFVEGETLDEILTKRRNRRKGVRVIQMPTNLEIDNLHYAESLSYVGSFRGDSSPLPTSTSLAQSISSHFSLHSMPFPTRQKPKIDPFADLLEPGEDTHSLHSSQSFNSSSNSLLGLSFHPPRNPSHSPIPSHNSSRMQSLSGFSSQSFLERSLTDEERAIQLKEMKKDDADTNRSRIGGMVWKRRSKDEPSLSSALRNVMADNQSSVSLVPHSPRKPNRHYEQVQSEISAQKGWETLPHAIGQSLDWERSPLEARMTQKTVTPSHNTVLTQPKLPVQKQKRIAPVNIKK
ncbi:hypothetical protein BLNAU_6340 [Blattamonas nauphoetae]|uniref:Uncharacterized protein n=1 Tax=Blattamonas nauphoetae TaxID=2049346 RepID=A0ABQ9Y497_9EUKA|nr:hypothetical protein BLNAU_6340 [Blattamonas nauphoetae]